MSTVEAWNQNATFWDNKMGEGNDFHLKLVAPATEELLTILPGQKILDIACGNGQFSRRLKSLGAQVTACDGSSQLIQLAKE